ncbi:CDGSH iron-sulfur domain-containing protein [Peptococcus simiae]|uniref:CDGSH iron-sulfur domain-containing protein n=1 Tax=Peptococcus simiae TaxID=1643805 RepID=UPI003980FBA2
MMAKEEKKIIVTEAGPYKVQGNIPLYKEVLRKNEDGSYRWDEREALEGAADNYRLCRCGRTDKQPFCDGSHAKGDRPFKGTIRAPFDTVDDRAVVLEGAGVNLQDDIDLCSWSRFCHTPHGKVWDLLDKSDDPEVKDWLIQGCVDCPSGRLTAIDKESGEPIEPDLPMEIVVTQDPEEGISGPLVVRGGIPIENAEGQAWEVRNRVTLCRCGGSHNTPFCDARHKTISFDDGDLQAE